MIAHGVTNIWSKLAELNTSSGLLWIFKYIMGDDIIKTAVI